MVLNVIVSLSLRHKKHYSDFISIRQLIMLTVLPVEIVYILIIQLSFTDVSCLAITCKWLRSIILGFTPYNCNDITELADLTWKTKCISIGSKLSQQPFESGDDRSMFCALRRMVTTYDDIPLLRYLVKTAHIIQTQDYTSDDPKALKDASSIDELFFDVVRKEKQLLTEVYLDTYKERFGDLGTYNKVSPLEEGLAGAAYLGDMTLVNFYWKQLEHTNPNIELALWEASWHGHANVLSLLLTPRKQLLDQALMIPALNSGSRETMDIVYECWSLNPDGTEEELARCVQDYHDYDTENDVSPPISKVAIDFILEKAPTQKSTILDNFISRARYTNNIETLDYIVAKIQQTNIIRWDVVMREKPCIFTYWYCMKQGVKLTEQILCYFLEPENSPTIYWNNGASTTERMLRLAVELGSCEWSQIDQWAEKSQHPLLMEICQNKRVIKHRKIMQ